jgi:hypothetical protein
VIVARAVYHLRYEEVALLEKATSQLIDAARQQGIPHDALPALVKRRLERDFLAKDGMPE